MRVLLVSDEPDDAGMGGPKVALKLQAGLQRLGHVTDILFRPQLGARPRDPRLRLALGPWLARRAVEKASLPYDVVDAASAEGWLLSPRLRRTTAVIARSHGLEHRYYQALLADAHAGTRRKPWTRRIWYPALRLPQVAAALRRADRAILLSRNDRQFVVKRGWLPDDRTEIIPHGVDADRRAQAPSPRATRGGGILFCGWWTVGKGTPDLAHAHALLLARGLAVPLTLLGVGEAEDTGLEGRIRAQFSPASQPLLRILPRTRNEDEVFAAYRSHDLLVCPSTSEGFGLVIVEALSQRLPVVCSANVGAADLLQHGREALITPARQPEALAGAMAQVWQSAPLRVRLGDAGHARTRDLSWDHVAQRTLNCYCAAIETHRQKIPGRKRASSGGPSVAVPS